MLLNSFLCYRSCIYLLQATWRLSYFSEFTGYYAYLTKQKLANIRFKRKLF